MITIILFSDPPIWIYYDVITDKQIESFKKLAKPKVNKFKNI